MPKLDLNRAKDDMARHYRRLQRIDALAKAVETLLHIDRQVDDEVTPSVSTLISWRKARKDVENLLIWYWGDDAQ